MSFPHIHFPPKLHPGDRVAVIAPAGPFDPVFLQQGMKIWQDRGFIIQTNPDIFLRDEYLAGSDAKRTGIINDALADPQIKALVCARGGYGSMRLFDSIDFRLIDQNPKIIVGFSDITALLLEIWNRNRLVTFSGPMIAGTQLGKMIKNEIDQFFSILQGNMPSALSGPKARFVNNGKAVGRLLGGNLTLLVHLAASGRLPSLENAILFMEDVNEAPYRIDRALTALRIGRHLKNVAGIALGSFGEQFPDETLDRIALNCLGDLSVPIIAGLSFGHHGLNRLIPVGVEVEIRNDKPQIIFLQSGTC